MIKFIKYLLKRKADDISWITVIICRARKHPCGVLWFNANSLEPDMTCQKCGDDLS